jgi:hypothetical protein
MIMTSWSAIVCVGNPCPSQPFGPDFEDKGLLL